MSLRRGPDSGHGDYPGPGLDRRPRGDPGSEKRRLAGFAGRPSGAAARQHPQSSEDQCDENRRCNTRASEQERAPMGFYLVLTAVTGPLRDGLRRRIRGRGSDAPDRPKAPAAVSRHEWHDAEPATEPRSGDSPGNWRRRACRASSPHRRPARTRGRTARALYTVPIAATRASASSGASQRLWNSRQVMTRDSRLADSAMDAATAQVLGQLGPGAMEPGLDGADRPRDRLGDLLVGQILLVEQGEDQAIFGPEGAGARGPARRPGRRGRRVRAADRPDPRSTPASAIGGRRARRASAVRQRLAAISSSQGRSGRDVSNPAMDRKARRNVSWTTSSASWRWLIMR